MDDNVLMITFLIVFLLFVLFLLIARPQMYDIVPNKIEPSPTHYIGQTYWPVTNMHWKGDYHLQGPNASPRWDPFPPPINPPRNLPIKGIGTYYINHTP